MLKTTNTEEPLRIYHRLGDELESILKRILLGQTNGEIANSFYMREDVVRRKVRLIRQAFNLLPVPVRNRYYYERKDIINWMIKNLPDKVREINPDLLKKALENNDNGQLTVNSGTISVDSKYYVERNDDRLCLKCLTTSRNGGMPLIRIKGSSGMGRSSLLIKLRHLLQQEHEQIIGFVDLGSAYFEPESFTSLNKLLYDFTSAVAKEFKDKLNGYTPPNLQDYWREDIVSGTLCTDYLKDHIFSKIDASKTLLIDGVDTVLGQEKTQNPFLNLLRTWNEQEMKDVGQEKIVWPRIAIAYSTEPYPYYGIKSSILQNVGIELELEEFSANEVKYLAAKYGLNWSLDEVKILMNLIGGHPTLVNQALYQISQEGMSLSKLKEESASRNGPFRDHLLSKLELLEENEESLQCLQKILKGEECRDEFALFQLEKAGLICKTNEKVRVKFELYQKYFEAHI